MTPSNIGPNGNVFLENDQTVTADTPLLPFRREWGDFWTTNSCRDTTVLSYAYPETHRVRFNSKQEFQNNALRVIADLYNDRTRELLTVQQHVTASAMGTKHNGHTLRVHNTTFTDWNIQSQVTPSALLPSTFMVRFALKGEAKNGDDLDVGTWMRLMPAATHPSGSNESQIVHTSASEQPFYGITSLTAHLLELIAAGQLASLERADVVPFLERTLSWEMYAVSRYLFMLVTGSEIANGNRIMVSW